MLQRRYPSAAPAIAASTIQLRNDAFITTPRVFSTGPRRTNLIFVGALEQYHKAPDVLVRSFANALGRGLNLHLTIVGAGKHQRDLEELSAELNCRDQIHFAGQLATGAQVYAALDNADLFVLPSRCEGLPRAMLEAMTRGLPCIGSDAGGIPELLPADAIVPAGDVRALADRICEVAQDPARMSRMSARNLEHAKAYRGAVLQERRVGFYRGVRAATEAWLRVHA
jgi:glycosyltransferase involved in cell wall biosynthesis